MTTSLTSSEIAGSTAGSAEATLNQLAELTASAVANEQPRRANEPAPQFDAVPAPSPAQPFTAVDVLAIASGCGLLSGAIEGVMHTLARARGEFIMVHLGVLWAAPLTLAVLCLLPTALLTLLGRFTRHPAGGQLAVTLSLLIGSLNLLMLVPGMSFIAELLLAAGIASATATAISSHQQRIGTTVRRVVPVLLITFVALAAWDGISQRRTEQQALAALSPVPVSASATSEAAASPPNVILIVLDTLRANAVGPRPGESGSAEPTLTPHLDDIARQGIQFRNATAAAPWTLPSTAGLLTGHLPHETGADWLTPLRPEFPTIAEFMRDRGYATAAFAANNHYCTQETGIARGFIHFEGHVLSLEEMLLCTAIGREFFMSTARPVLGSCDMPARRSAREISDSALTWLDQHRDEHSQRPAFMLLNYLDVHDPYLADPAFRRTAPQTASERIAMRFWWYLDRANLTPRDVKLMRDSYEDCVRSLDAQIGWLAGQLDKRGMLDNTVIIITSDHGEHFGDHGLYLHGNSLYEALLHVPLIMTGPADLIPSGQVVDAPVSLLRLPATVAELTSPTGVHPFPTTSLRTVWQSAESSDPSRGSAEAHRPAAGEPVFAEVISPPVCPPCQGKSPVFRGSMASVRLGDFKLIRNGDGELELYDLRHDPSETRNLAVSTESIRQHPTTGNDVGSNVEHEQTASEELLRRLQSLLDQRVPTRTMQ